MEEKLKKYILIYRIILVLCLLSGLVKLMLNRGKGELEGK